MDWKQFQELIRHANDWMRTIKEDFPEEEERDFLNGTSLVVSIKGKQLSIRNTDSLLNIFEEMKGLEIITDSTLKDHLLALSKRVSSIRAQFDQKEIKQTEMEKSIAAILADIQAVPTESIEIEDSISVSMIFPRVTMPIIRKIMKHPLVCIVPVS